MECVVFAEEESREQVRRMAEKAAQVDAARVQMQEGEGRLQEISEQLTAAQQELHARSEEAQRLGASAEEAAAALVAARSETASAFAEKEDAIKFLQVRTNYMSCQLALPLSRVRMGPVLFGLYLSGSKHCACLVGGASGHAFTVHL